MSARPRWEYVQARRALLRAPDMRTLRHFLDALERDGGWDRLQTYRLACAYGQRAQELLYPRTPKEAP